MMGWVVSWVLVVGWGRGVSSCIFVSVSFWAGKERDTGVNGRHSVWGGLGFGEVLLSIPLLCQFQALDTNIMLWRYGLWVSALDLLKSLKPPEDPPKHASEKP